MLKRSKTPFVRDVYLSYLIRGAQRTKTDEYPIIEKWMVAKKPPKDIFQWDRRKDVKNPLTSGMSFYCNDPAFNPILGNPKGYIDKLNKYMLVIGMDASPYDNMPLVVQKSQIYLNLAISYYFGSVGIPIIPNVRLGDMRTISSLEAYPKGTLIAIGTNGFVKSLANRKILAEQIKIVIDELLPSGICVYGPDKDELFKYAKERNIPIYQYDSYTMKQNKLDKQRREIIWKVIALYS